MLMPVIESVLHGGIAFNPDNDDNIHPTAFGAAHAIQILMFAPMELDKDQEYTVKDLYLHYYMYLGTLRQRGLAATKNQY